MRRQRSRITWFFILRLALGGIVLLGVGAVSAFGLMLWRVEQQYVEHNMLLGLRSYLPPDQEMIEHFRVHRSTLEELVALARRLPSGARVAVDYTDREVPVALIEPIRELLWRAKVYRVVTDNDGDVEITYAAYGSGWGDDGWYKDFLWVAVEPQFARIVPSLDAYEVNLGSNLGIALMHIEANWYLRYIEMH